MSNSISSRSLRASHRRRLHLGPFRTWHLPTLALLALLGACGRSFDARPLDATLRPIIERALAEALRDSALYAASPLSTTGMMRVDMRNGDDRVQILDTFRAAKKPAGELATTVTGMSVHGDSSILREMYSFRPPGSKIRSFEETQIDRMSFGADMRKMFRGMLAGKEKMAVRLVDSASMVGGRPCYLISFETSDGRGSMALDRRSAELVTIRINQGDDYMLAGFDYAMSIEYARAADGATRGPIFPRNMQSKFSYRRPFSRGTGTIVVVFDTVALR